MKGNSCLEAAVAELPLPRSAERLRARLAEKEEQIATLLETHNQLAKALGDCSEMFELAPVGYLCLDSYGKVVKANTTATTVLGLDRSRLLGQSFPSLVAKPSRKTFTQFLGARFANLGPGSCELEMVPNPGSAGWVRMHGRASGDLCRVAFADVTEQKRMEEENKRQADALLKSEKLVSLGLLAGGIAYDFNKLLASILGNMETVRFHLAEEAAEQIYLDNMRTAILKAAMLVKQMLAYSGQDRFTFAPTHPNLLLESIRPLISAGLPGSIFLHYDLASDVPVFMADVPNLQEVILVLVRNAMEAIGDKPGSIGIATRKVAVAQGEGVDHLSGQPMEAGEYVAFEVTDDGAGMTGAVLRELFDPFFSTKGKGRGLGLAAAQGVLKAHRAAVQVASEVGAGTTVTLFFPTSGPG